MHRTRRPTGTVPRGAQHAVLLARCVFIVLCIELVAACASQTRQGYSPLNAPVEATIGNENYADLARLDLDRLSRPVANLSAVSLPANKSRIVVVRPRDSQFLLKLGVADAERLMGIVPVQGCLFWDRNPGQLTLKVGLGAKGKIDRAFVVSEDAWHTTIAVTPPRGMVAEPSRQISVQVRPGTTTVAIVNGKIDLSSASSFGVDISLNANEGLVDSVCREFRYSTADT
jgi:hypothetical protein